MPPFGPISRRELLRTLRLLGFQGPYSGGKHQFMIRGNVTVRAPNPHDGDIGLGLFARAPFTSAGVSGSLGVGAALRIRLGDQVTVDGYPHPVARVSRLGRRRQRRDGREAGRPGPSRWKMCSVCRRLFGRAPREIVAPHAPFVRCGIGPRARRSGMGDPAVSAVALRPPTMTAHEVSSRAALGSPPG